MFRSLIAYITNGSRGVSRSAQGPLPVRVNEQKGRVISRMRQHWAFDNENAWTMEKNYQPRNKDI